MARDLEHVIAAAVALLAIPGSLGGARPDDTDPITCLYSGRGQEPDPGEYVIATATRLFTALGYDGTPIEMIADATGLDVATITTLVGDKPALYVSVIHRLKAEQCAMFDAAIAEFTQTGLGVGGQWRNGVRAGGGGDRRDAPVAASVAAAGRGRPRGRGGITRP